MAFYRSWQKTLLGSKLLDSKAMSNHYSSGCPTGCDGRSSLMSNVERQLSSTLNGNIGSVAVIGKSLSQRPLWPSSRLYGSVMPDTVVCIYWVLHARKNANDLLPPCCIAPELCSRELCRASDIAVLACSFLYAPYTTPTVQTETAGSHACRSPRPSAGPAALLATTYR